VSPKADLEAMAKRKKNLFPFRESNSVRFKFGTGISWLQV